MTNEEMGYRAAIRDLRLEARHYELLAVQVPSHAKQYREMAVAFDKAADLLANGESVARIGGVS